MSNLSVQGDLAGDALQELSSVLYHVTRIKARVHSNIEHRIHSNHLPLMAPRTTKTTTADSSRALRSQNRAAAQEKENTQILTTKAKPVTKAVKAPRKKGLSSLPSENGQDAVEAPGMGCHTSEGFDEPTVEEDVKDTNHYVELFLPRHSGECGRACQRLAVAILMEILHSQAVYVAAAGKLDGGSQTVQELDTPKADRSVASDSEEDAMEHNVAPSYSDEPSYQLDPDDPFGFAAAERKIKHRQQMLKEQARQDGRSRKSRGSVVQAPVAFNLSEEEGDDDDDEPERAFATPRKPRPSMRRPPRPSSVPPIPLESLREDCIEIYEEEPSVKMTTEDLEQLLPKRRACWKGRRVGRKANAAHDEPEDGKPRRGRKPQERNHEDEEEAEVIDVDLDDASAKVSSLTCSLIQQKG